MQKLLATISLNTTLPDAPRSPPPDCSWITDTYELSKLKPYAEDAAFQEQWRAVKLENKKKLAAYIKETFGDDVPLNALFDIQVRRVILLSRRAGGILTAHSVIWLTHPFRIASTSTKRQPMNVLSTIQHFTPCTRSPFYSLFIRTLPPYTHKSLSSNPTLTLPHARAAVCFRSSASTSTSAS